MRNAFSPTLAVLALFAGFFSGPVGAEAFSPEELDQQVKSAETLATDRKFVEALDAMRTATVSVWEAAPPLPQATR